MAYLILQSVLAIILLVSSALSGWGPLVLLTIMQKKGKDQSDSGWLSYLSCFSGGVFMATCFLDVVPHLNQNYQSMLEKYHLEYPVPLNQVFICCGFFLVYFIEAFTSKLFGTDGHGHSHGGPLTVDVKRENVTRQVLLEDGSASAPTLPVSNTVPTENRGRHSLAVEEASPWVVSDEKKNVLKSLTFAVAMSFHSLLEGFALGVQDTTTAIWTLFFSLLLHKCIEAFSVGLQITRANSAKRYVVIITISIYALMTPFGSILGTVLQSTGGDSFLKEFLIVFLESLAAGTFVYVTFLEVLAAEKENRFNSLKQLASIIAGFIVILLLQIAFGHEAHGHSHAVVVDPSPSSSIIVPTVSFSPSI
uniref:Zinc transporter ZIP3 n=1 Tax=Caenorhabditis tropicalis TaxID=1561998 RepID=A0A1I7UN99_9PELO